MALLGPNGAGKSTSLDMLLALRKPTGGRIRIFGSDPCHAVKSGRVGAMLQSGGQAQRVRFALAMVGETDLLVLDELTAAMDVETRQPFWAIMNAEVAEGQTLLFATHYLEEADGAADRILVLNKGRLLADGTPAQIKARAGAKRISFRIDAIDETALRRLPGLVSLEVRHDVVHLRSADSDRTLYALLDAGYRPREIEVTSLGLEQAFLAITAADNLNTAAPAGAVYAHAGEAVS